MLLRLGHQFAVGEDDLLSRPVNVSVAQLLSSFKVVATSVSAQCKAHLFEITLYLRYLHSDY